MLVGALVLSGSYSFCFQQCESLSWWCVRAVSLSPQPSPNHSNQKVTEASSPYRIFNQTKRVYLDLPFLPRRNVFIWPYHFYKDETRLSDPISFTQTKHVYLDLPYLPRRNTFIWTYYFYQDETRLSGPTIFTQTKHVYLEPTRNTFIWPYHFYQDETCLSGPTIFTQTKRVYQALPFLPRPNTFIWPYHFYPDKTHSSSPTIITQTKRVYLGKTYLGAARKTSCTEKWLSKKHINCLAQTNTIKGRTEEQACFVWLDTFLDFWFSTKNWSLHTHKTIREVVYHSWRFGLEILEAPYY